MFRLIPLLALFCLGCVAEQPESARTVAAFEVPLPTPTDKQVFLEVLREVAEARGYHVDAWSDGELRHISELTPITFNASVWRGNDQESMASAMDFSDRIGRVWISFPQGEDPERSTEFREALMLKIEERWPETASLPIMPNGAIPNPRDLVRTPSGYEVEPSEASKYSAPEPG